MNISTLDAIIDAKAQELADDTGRIDAATPGPDRAQASFRYEFTSGYVAALRHLRYALAHPEWDPSSLSGRRP